MACNEPELHEMGDAQLPRDVARWFASRKLRPNAPTLMTLGVTTCNELKLVSKEEWNVMMNSLDPPLTMIERRAYGACIDQVSKSQYELLASNSPWTSSAKGTPSGSQVRGRTSDATPRVGASVKSSTAKGKLQGLSRLWKSIPSPETNVVCESFEKDDTASPSQESTGVVSTHAIESEEESSISRYPGRCLAAQKLDVPALARERGFWPDFEDLEDIDEMYKVLGQGCTKASYDSRLLEVYTKKKEDLGDAAETKSKLEAVLHEMGDGAVSHSRGEWGSKGSGGLTQTLGQGLAAPALYSSCEAQAEARDDDGGPDDEGPGEPDG